MSENNRQPLISVEHLEKYFPVRAGLLRREKAWVQAVDDVSRAVVRQR